MCICRTQTNLAAIIAAYYWRRYIVTIFVFNIQTPHILSRREGAFIAPVYILSICSFNIVDMN